MNLTVTTTWLYWLLTFVLSVDGDLFSSIFGLEQLMLTERGFEKIVNDYVDAEMIRLNRLKQALSDPAFVPLSGGELDASGGLSNPINAYRLVKRHVVDSTSTLNLMRRNSAEEYIERLANEYIMPSTEDLEGAAAAIFRLQDTYLLTPEDFASGIIPGAVGRTPMDANDCFLLANIAFQNRDFYHAIPWLFLVESRLNSNMSMNERALLNFNHTMVYDYLSYSMYAQHNIEWAVHYSRLLTSIDPTYVTASYLPIYEELLGEKNSTWDGRVHTLPEYNNPRLIPPMFQNYEALCRGENFLAPTDTSSLYCYYRRDNPYLLLAPIKVERLFNDPEVVIFREVLTDRETDFLKEISGPNLRRALVVNTHKTDNYELDNVEASFRVAKNYWVPEHHYPMMEHIASRIDLMTGLDLGSSEQLQIQNYGMGGHYEPHFDMAMEDEDIDINNESMGNRVATLLFYLSEPEAGGATVFEELKISVYPSKNDALFWHNIRRDGKPDLRTRHAACPVIYGQKWVANKWLHERGQEFRRKCALEPGV